MSLLTAEGPGLPNEVTIQLYHSVLPHLANKSHAQNGFRTAFCFLMVSHFSLIPQSSTITYDLK